MLYSFLLGDSEASEFQTPGESPKRKNKIFDFIVFLSTIYHLPRLGRMERDERIFMSGEPRGNSYR